MSIELNSHTDHSDTSTDDWTVSTHTVAGINRFLVAVMTGTQIPDAAPTWNGTSMTLIDNTVAASPMYGLIAPDVGALDFNVTYPAFADVCVHLLSLNEVDQDVGYENYDGLSTGDATPSISLVNPEGQWTFSYSAFTDYSGGSHTIPGHQTGIENTASQSHLASSYTTTINPTHSYTRNGGGPYNAQRIAGISIIPFGGAGGLLVNRGLIDAGLINRGLIS